MKNKALKQLDEICQKVSEAYGTLRSYGMEYDQAITKQIERCYEIGVTREQIQTILNKYMN